MGKNTNKEKSYLKFNTKNILAGEIHYLELDENSP